MSKRTYIAFRLGHNCELDIVRCGRGEIMLTLWQFAGTRARMLFASPWPMARQTAFAQLRAALASGQIVFES